MEWDRREESTDVFEPMDESERKSRAFDILVTTVQERLETYGVEVSVQIVTKWIDSLEDKELRIARKQAIESESELKYVDIVAEEIIQLYLPLDNFLVLYTIPHISVV
jgi:hypothetical protein